MHKRALNRPQREGAYQMGTERSVLKKKRIHLTPRNGKVIILLKKQGGIARKVWRERHSPFQGKRRKGVQFFCGRNRNKLFEGC